MNSIFMRFPDGKSKALTLSYDDGVEQDIKLLELMEKYNIFGAFNLNSGLYAAEGTVYPTGTIHRRMTKKRCDELFTCPNAEVASHSLTHPHIAAISPAMAMSQIVDDRKNLEHEFSQIVRGFAYPFGDCSDELVEILRLSGIVYARTTISSHKFDIPHNWLRLAATCHHKDEALMQLAEKFLEDVPAKDPYLFYLWGHSYEFEADDNWFVIEDFFKCISNDSNVWYATNIQIYDYIAAYEGLIFASDGSYIQNPSATAVWCLCDSKLILIPPGQTIRTDVT